MWAHSQDAAHAVTEAEDPHSETSGPSSFTQIRAMLEELIDKRVQESIVETATNMAQVVQDLSVRLTKIENSHRLSHPSPPHSFSPGVNYAQGVSSGSSSSMHQARRLATIDEHATAYESELSHVCSRLASLEKEMSGWAGVLGNWKAEANGHLRSLSSRIDHVDQLMAMQTQAIRQTWSWLLAVVQTVQQHTQLPQDVMEGAEETLEPGHRSEQDTSGVGTLVAGGSSLPSTLEVDGKDYVVSSTTTQSEERMHTPEQRALLEAFAGVSVSVPTASATPSANVDDGDADLAIDVLETLLGPVHAEHTTRSPTASQTDVDHAECAEGDGVVTLSDTE
eukprot:3095112-Amphidinium_carterae.2